MKNFNKYFLMILSIILLNSCSNDDDQSFVTPVSYNIHVSFDEEFGSTNVSGVKLVLTNNETSKKYQATTNEEGYATVSVLPGTYQINASITYDAKKMQMMFGTSQETSFNASKDIQVKQGGGTTNLILTSGKVGNLVIKQVYYAGSDVRKAASFRDQFVEIYNNSNKVVYLDGLCFAELKDNLKISSTSKPYYDTDGSYDWSQSYQLKGMGAKANTDYIYADEVLQIPGSGKDYPLAPGKSTIIAANALNHKQPLTVKIRGKEKTYTVSNPELTIDLSKAPFEVYFGDYFGGKPFFTDIDTPAKNVNILYKTSGNRDLILDTFGRDAFAIFYAKQQDIDKWKKVALPSLSDEKAETSNNLLLQIPDNVVIDAVDIQNYKESDQKPKWLQDNLDAGFIKGIKGKYSSESAIRKVYKTIGNRVIYQDTNNSTNDFQIIDLPDVSSLN